MRVGAAAAAGEVVAIFSDPCMDLGHRGERILVNQCCVVRFDYRRGGGSLPGSPEACCWVYTGCWVSAGHTLGTVAGPVGVAEPAPGYPYHSGQAGIHHNGRSWAVAGRGSRTRNCLWHLVLGGRTGPARAVAGVPVATYP